jgi:hypothetical protein
MKSSIAIVLLGLGLASAPQASESAAGDGLAAYEQVKSITAFRGPYSWSVIDDDTLIVWANAFDPYLVELKQPSQNLRFALAIGITQFGSQIHADTDAIQVRGFRYPIGGIYRLSREQAKELRQDARGS